MRYFIVIACIVTGMLSSCREEPTALSLGDLDLSGMPYGFGKSLPASNTSVSGNPLSVAGVIFKKGIGTSAVSALLFDLHGKSLTISGKAGVDDMAKEAASVKFYILGDKKILWESGIMRRGDSARVFNLKLKRVKLLGMLVTDANDGISQDYADWPDVSITYRGDAPSIPLHLAEKPYFLTPPAPPEPRINGPVIDAVRPGSPYLFRIPCTGERPVTFSALSLPAGLLMDTLTGIISGTIKSPGSYVTTITAKNSRGECRRDFKIVAGEKLMLTPSMGWNSWYIHKREVTDSIMRNAADIMLSNGMADNGYQYVNIDDCWNVIPDSKDPVLGGPTRDRNGKLLTNKRFPNMKTMTGYIHSKGLKAGIYISPGEKTCGGFEGSYGHEATDAQTFAEWGFDFLKYDWCTYEKLTPDHSRESLKAPFELMSRELKKQKRDIVFNLCQYGMGKVWEWGGAIGQSWRTTGDIAWMKNMSMPQFYYIGRSNADHWEYAKPGNWNDPDYIIMGYVKDPFRKNQIFHNNLTQSEQYFYMSMWSLMASPLIFSGDMGRIDEYLLNVLCNNEVIDINIDTLGRQAKILRESNGELVMSKELANGDLALGLFHVTGVIKDPAGFPLNHDKQLKIPGFVEDIPPEADPAGYFNWGETIRISVSAKELGITGPFKVRDVWRQKDLGEYSDHFEAEIPYHGVCMIRIIK